MRFLSAESNTPTFARTKQNRTKTWPAQCLNARGKHLPEAISDGVSAVCHRFWTACLVCFLRILAINCLNLLIHEQENCGVSHLAGGSEL